jgi:ParB/RepB/Spo0J family partition protein
MHDLPIDQLKEHPKQREFFKPLEGRAWEEFYTDLNARGMLQPVVISDRTGDWVIADGHQRVRAAKYLGWLEVPCIIGEFTDEREEVRCLVMNNARRRQLSREEVDAIIEYWLANYTGRSNNWIASDLGVSDMTVEKKRQEMESTSQIRKLDKLEGKDGRVRPRTQPKREVVTESHNLPDLGEDSSLYSEGAISDEIPGLEPQKSARGIDNNDPPIPKVEPLGQNVYETYDLASTQPAPTPPPGWQPTENRKQLERAATILTKLDTDEAREELERDQTLRAFLMSAYRQLGEMLEATHDEKLITLTKSFN